MALKKTTILPTDDANKSQEFLRELIVEQPHVLFVVLGASTKAEELVKIADMMSGNENDLRWVVWARKPEYIIDIINDLDGEEKVGLEDIGLTISLYDTVAKVINETDPINKFSVLHAYIKAEKGES